MSAPDSGAWNLWGWSNQGTVQNLPLSTVTLPLSVDFATKTIFNFVERWRGERNVGEPVRTNSLPKDVTLKPGRVSDDVEFTFGKRVTARLVYDKMDKLSTRQRERLTRLFDEDDSPYRTLGTEVTFKMHAEFAEDTDGRWHVANFWVVPIAGPPGSRSAFALKFEVMAEATTDYTALRLFAHVENTLKLPLCCCGKLCKDWSRAEMHKTSELLIRGDGVWTEGTGCFEIFAGRQSQVSRASDVGGEGSASGPPARSMAGTGDDPYVEQPVERPSLAAALADAAFSEAPGRTGTDDDGADIERGSGGDTDSVDLTTEL